MNSETQIILNALDQLRATTDDRIDDLRSDFSEVKADIREIRKDNKGIVEKLDDYASNHYAYHRREKKTLWRWIIILFIVIVIIGAAGLGEIIVPYALSLLRFIPL